MWIAKTKTFDELTTHELYAILQLRMEVFVVEQQCPYQDCDNKDKYATHILVYEADRLVAYCRILPKGVSYKDYCAIGRVVTHPDIRNQGAGKYIMQQAINYCQEHYTDPIQISAQQYLENFYRSFGFHTVSEPYLEDNIPHLAMRIV